MITIRRFALSSIVAVVLAASGLLNAQTPPNLSGTWSGTLTRTEPPGGNPSSALLILTQKDGTLTGTAGPDESSRSEILNGKVTTTKEGTSVTFETDNGTMTMKFALKLADGRLTGTVNAQRGDQKMAGTLDVSKAK